MPTKKKGNEPSIKPNHKGRLHAALGIEGPIPLSALMKAKDSDNTHLREMANYAIGARGWDHSK